jgi:hypothetical protein
MQNRGRWRWAMARFAVRNKAQETPSISTDPSLDWYWDGREKRRKGVFCETRLAKPGEYKTKPAAEGEEKAFFAKRKISSPSDVVRRQVA